MSQKLNYSFGKNTQLGKEKQFNTDSILDFPIPDGHVFLVCDGHDGAQGHGALASKLTSESIKKYFFNRSYTEMLSALTNAVTFANYSLFEQSQKDEKYAGIGSTLAIVIYKNNKIYYAYAGDSRIYLFSNDKLQALTLDHVDDKYNPKDSTVNVLIGRSNDIKFGVCKNPIELKEFDKLLLCTDGLNDYVINDEIKEIIRDNDTSPDHKAVLLAQKVDENEGADNVSVQVVEFDHNHPVPAKNKSLAKVLKNVVVPLLVLVGVVFAGYKGYEYFINMEPATEKVEVIPETNVVVEPKVEKAEVVAVEKSKETKKEVVVKDKPKAKETPITPKANAEKVETQYFNHKILFGENLYRLSLRYGVSQQKLKDINGKKAIDLIAGASLKIPVKAIHLVKRGESYSVLSDKYNTKIDIICRANNIEKSQALTEGKTIVIPFK